jgi:hypothetical protein
MTRVARAWEVGRMVGGRGGRVGTRPTGKEVVKCNLAQGARGVRPDVAAQQGCHLVALLAAGVKMKTGSSCHCFQVAHSCLSWLLQWALTLLPCCRTALLVLLQPWGQPAAMVCSQLPASWHLSSGLQQLLLLAGVSPWCVHATAHASTQQGQLLMQANPVACFQDVPRALGHGSALHQALSGEHSCQRPFRKDIAPGLLPPTSFSDAHTAICSRHSVPATCKPLGAPGSSLQVPTALLALGLRPSCTLPRSHTPCAHSRGSCGPPAVLALHQLPQLPLLISTVRHTISPDGLHGV